MEKIKLVELNRENWYECCQLKVSTEQQKYIIDNTTSIAQTKFEPTLKAYVIYDDTEMVGFLMYNTVLEELDAYWIFRIMVDEQYQGKGIGKKATQLMLEKMAKLPNAKKIVVGYDTENIGAHNLYRSLGFVDHGDRFGKEMAVIKYVD